jgi:hypothetical protein
LGKKGHYGDNPLLGPITAPIGARFRAEEKLILGNIKKALDLYKASDPRGRGPQSHAEFMEKIIKANLISLPELPDNEAYQYDPATEQLMVVPKK